MQIKNVMLKTFQSKKNRKVKEFNIIPLTSMEYTGHYRLDVNFIRICRTQQYRYSIYNE